jgi:hypothetical protein
MLRLLLVGGTALTLWCSRPVIDPDKKDCYFSKADLVRLYPHLQAVETKAECGLKTRSGKPATYDYRIIAPDSADYSLFVQNTIHFNQTPAQAGSRYRSLLLGHRIGQEFFPTEMIARDGYYHWGDESFYGEYVMNGEPYGQFFLTRTGTTVFMLAVSGLYMDKNTLAQLLDPLLWALPAGPDRPGEK